MPCPALARGFLILFNVLFVIFGLLCTAIGIWVRLDNSSMLTLFRISSNTVDLESYNVPSLLERGAYTLIAVGVLVFFVAIFGFCGAIKKNRCCLITYGVLVGIILIIQLAAGVIAAIFKSKFDAYAQTFLNKTAPMMYVGPYNDTDIVSKAVDILQVSQTCCGVNGPDDYSFYPRWNRTWSGGNATIPFTCCKSKKAKSFPEKRSDFISGLNDANCPVTKAASYTEGCYTKLKSLFYTYYKVMMGVAIGVAFIEFILIVIACCMAKNNTDEIV